MKSAIAAFVAAAASIDQQRGTISLLITGDEEGPATFGTPAIIDWLREREIAPDMILIGEPTSETRLGDTVKIGRRGSVNMWIEVPGTQGHVAYPHRADNPVPPLARLVAALDAVHLDDGNDAFPPSNLEFTDISAPAGATNLIPGSASTRLNIRFNNLQRGADLVRMVEEIAEREAPGSKVDCEDLGRGVPDPAGRTLRSGRRSDRGRDRASRPICRPAAARPTAATSSQLCPVVDFGLPNATMHKLDESAAVEDIHALSRIYRRILEKVLG